MSFPGLTNYSVDVPGTTVTCHMGVWDSAPTVWVYSLWEDDMGDANPGTLLATGEMDLDGLPDVRPDQVARVAFLLECEYVPTAVERGPSGEHNVGPW